MFQLYLVRHGESANNALPEAQRVSDPSLTPLGKQQADLLGERFARMAADNEKMDVLLTSAFLRAIQTVRPIAGNLQMRPEIRTDLYEVGGCYSGHLPGEKVGDTGLTRAQLHADFPEYDVPDDIDEHGWYKRKPVETHAQAVQRAAEQAQRLRSEFEGRSVRVLCLIHADFKRLLLQEFVTDPHYADALLNNTSVTHLQFSGAAGSEPEIVVHNDISHLTHDLHSV